MVYGLIVFGDRVMVFILNERTKVFPYSFVFCKYLSSEGVTLKRGRLISRREAIVRSKSCSLAT